MAKIDPSSDTSPQRGRLPSPGCLFAVTLLLILVPVCCWIGWRVHRQEARLEYFEQIGVRRIVTKPARPVWLHGLVDATLGPERASGFTDVTSINLGDVQITDAVLQHVSGLANLRELWLNDSQVTDADLRHLKDLGSLETLVFNHTQVTDAGLRQLSGLTTLRGLALSDAQVTDAGLGHLSGLTKLEVLRLDGNVGVTDAGLRHLRDLTNLQVIYLGDTQVTEAGVDELRSQLPGAEIEW